MMVYVWGALLFALIGGCRPEDPVVELNNYGTIEGLEVVRPSGSVLDTFRGIPYAKAPLGNLRFEKPEAPEPLSGGTFNAKNFGAPCWAAPEMAAIVHYPIPFSEDCLSLNVMKPKKPSAEEGGYPVMVWIHGGGFTMGSALEYGFGGILDQIVDKDVIYVSIQYRLNVLGFYSLEEGTSLDNYGLWDQTLALKWVHDNIAAFGGDPTRLTVFGESAGGASVGIQTIVTHARDYVQGAIAMSGGPNCPWAVRPRGDLKGPSSKLAQLVGCTGGDVLGCMKLISHQSAGKFGPVLDGDYFEKSIEELIDESPNIPIIAGVTELEGGFFTTPLLPTPAPFAVDTSRPFTVDDFLAHSVQAVKTNQKYAQMDDALLKSVVQYNYLDRHHGPLTEASLLRLYTKVVGDITIVNDAFDFALCKRRAGSNVYLYQFDYFDPLVFPPGHKNNGAYHGSDVDYLFNTTIFYPPHDFDQQDDFLLQLYTTLLTNFAKFRDPTPSGLGLTWRAVMDDAPLQYLSIAPEPRMKASLGDSLPFWLNFVPTLTDQCHTKCPHCLCQ